MKLERFSRESCINQDLKFRLFVNYWTNLKGLDKSVHDESSSRGPRRSDWIGNGRASIIIYFKRIKSPATLENL